MKCRFIIFYAIFLVNFSLASGQNLDELFTKISTTKTPKNCQFLPNASLYITNKTDGKTEKIDFEIKNPLKFDYLEIEALQCCNLGDESYAFIKINNLKSNTEVFKGWMLSGFPSANSLEDPKFDLSVFKCF